MKKNHKKKTIIELEIKFNSIKDEYAYLINRIYGLIENIKKN
jgi:hypothetical protein